MILLRSKKNEIVNRVSDTIASDNFALLIAKNNGLPSTALNIMRDLIIMKNFGKVIVIKHRILNIVLKNSNFDVLEDLSGAHFLFYTKDIVTLVKFLDAFFKHDFLKDKIYYLYGYDQNKKLIDSNGIKDIIALPSQEEIMHRIAFAMRYPVMRVAGIHHTLDRMVYCLKRFNK